MYNNKYILGLDIGISSVGWGLLLLDDNSNPYRILDVGSRIFTPGEIEKTGDSRAKERREKRGSRRITRRREFRVDRVRNLLYENKYLQGNINSNIVSEKNNELTILYKNLIQEYYKNKNTNPYKLKVDALERKLEPEELCIILVHYAKKRGYKSNRESQSENDNGKVLTAIKENSELMRINNYRTISEMYVKDEKFSLKIKNSPNNYKVNVNREMYLDEINKVLDSQMNFGLINEKFKEEYLAIWQSQRHYSSGPGYYYEYDKNGNKIKKRSPYGGNLIEKMIGKCQYDNEPRAPKFAPSSEIFVSLTKLLNLRYKSDENKEYIGLNVNEIKSAINKSQEKNTLTYKDIVAIINKKNIKFKDLQLTNKEYLKFIEELKKKLDINKDTKINIKDLNDLDKKVYNELYEQKLFSKNIMELKGYHSLRSAIIKSFGKENWEKEKNDLELLDELALYCTNYKLNEDIKTAIQESSIVADKYIEDDFINKLPTFKDHLMLSTSLIRKIIPLMLEGKRYDEAMLELGYNFSNLNNNIEKKDLLVPINVNNNITNQRVIRSMTQARKVINAIIKKYGSPKMINIETARELAKSRQERNKIKKKQDENQVKNEKIKKELVELGLFANVDKINSTDILKYKIWQEQNEFCVYSRKKITLEDLFYNNTVQIDHILPYSRTFNDNYLNKTLVFTKENQEKGNQTPYEWIGNTANWEEYETFINNLNISPAKKDNYLLRSLDFDTERAMREQNLNDTKYISKELANLIKAYLNVEKVNVYQGAITAKLRARWGFNRLTHSLISETYYLPPNMKVDIKKDRDNYLHHAIDALVIAAITPSLQQKVTFYEKFSRYIDGLSKMELSNKLPNIETYTKDRYVDNETGDVIEKELKEYVKEQITVNHIYFNNHNIAKLDFPVPYENFVEETKIRVLEQNPEILKWKLQSLSTYSKKEIDNVHILTPSIAKAKISGAMHKETYYGLKKIGDNKYKTIRKSLNKIKAKDLESIPDKNGGSKDIYNAIKNWFGNYETGVEALKANNGKYPINPNDIEHKEIKKIKIYEEYKETGHLINGSYVEKGDVYQIEVFKSKNNEDSKLYFAAYDIYDIKKIEAYNKNKTKDSNFTIKLEYGQNNNYIKDCYMNIINNYKTMIKLNKKDLVEIVLINGKKSLAYIVGLSGGQLEVKSKLGDGFDIIGNNNIFNKKIERYYITVSQIKNIKKLQISILGEINGL